MISNEALEAAADAAERWDHGFDCRIDWFCCNGWTFRDLANPADSANKQYG